jgi:hypothetical protein
MQSSLGVFFGSFALFPPSHPRIASTCAN